MHKKLIKTKEKTWTTPCLTSINRLLGSYSWNKGKVAEHFVPYLAITGICSDSLQHVSLNLHHNVAF